MEPTIRISLGAIAFTFEESAYKLLQDYMSKLEERLSSEESSDEIIKDIEYRLSELFQIRLENQPKIVTQEDVTAVLKIMGNPEDFGVENQEAETEYSPKEYSSGKQQNKRLFRDKANGIIGGVCSGLSHYLRIDVVIIRLILIIPLFLWIFEFRFNELIAGEIILYLALWIVIPNAKSFDQKIAMTGSNQGAISNENYGKKYKGSGLREIFRTIYKIILVIAIIMSTLTCIAIIGFFVWTHLDQSVLYIDNYISMMGLDGVQIKTVTLLLLLIPAIGLLALFYKLFKETPFRTSSLVIFLLGFGIWIGAAIYTGNIGIRIATQTAYSAEFKESLDIDSGYPSLTITLGEEYEAAKKQPNNAEILYKENKGDKGNDICLIENIWIVEDEEIEDFQVEVIKHGAGNNYAGAHNTARNMKINYIIQDSLITLNPKWYNPQSPYDFSSTTLKIIKPKGKKLNLSGYLGDIYKPVY